MKKVVVGLGGLIKDERVFDAKYGTWHAKTRWKDALFTALLHLQSWTGLPLVSVRQKPAEHKTRESWEVREEPASYSVTSR